MLFRSFLMAGLCFVGGPAMLDITFQSNIADWTRELSRDQRDRIPLATSIALNQTGWEVREGQKATLPQVFDRPTRFTMNSVYFRKTRPGDNDQVVTVGFKDSNRFSRHYLMPQVEGGSRPHKRFEYWLIQRGLMNSDEYAVPAKGVRLDASGNLQGSILTQILSQLAASPDGHQWETVRSRARAGAKRARFFVPREGSALPRGVWRRMGKAISPVLVFTRAPQYQARYPFYDIGRDIAELRMPINFNEALNRVLATDRGV